jgi:probable phosphoglycerate mutase
MSFGRLEGQAWETLDPRWQDAMIRFEGFEPPEGETFDDVRRRVLAFVAALPPGRHLVFTHGGVLRLLSRELGEDQFVPTGSLLVVDWEARRIVFRRDGEGEPSRGLPTPTSAEEQEG